MAEWRYELQTNIGEVLNQIKTLQNRVDELENGKHQINLDIDSKKLEKVIANLDKMLESLGKGTGDFKEFENLSKELSSIVSEVQNLSKAFGKVDDSSTKTLLSSIQNIDKSLFELSQHIINVNKNMSNIGGDTNNAVKQVENISNAYDNAAKNAEKLADAQNKIGNKSNISSENSIVESQNKIQEELKETQEQAEETSKTIEKIISAYRGVDDKELIGKQSKNYGGKTFFTTSKELASEYGSEVFKADLLFKNLLDFDAKGSNWNKIKVPKIIEDYLNNIIDLSKEKINEAKIELKNIIGDGFQDIPFDKLLIKTNAINGETSLKKGYHKYANNFEEYWGQIKTIFEGLDNEEPIKIALEKLYNAMKLATSNMLQVVNNNNIIDVIGRKDGRYATDQIIGLAEKLGYDGTLIRNVYDNPASSNKEILDNILVAFSKNQFQNISPMKDVFQGDDKATTDASSTAIKEESQALEQVSTSAKEAATSKEKFANANKEVKVSADASTPSVKEESDALDKVSKRSRSDADNIKLEQRARIYKELNSSLDRYAIVAGRVANGKTLSTDEEEMARLQVRIEELQNEPILSETQLELSRTKLEKIETSLENIQEKLQLKRIDSIQTSIDSYNKDYKSRVNGKPVEENRGKEYQQLLDKYKASIDTLQAKKDELSKQSTISEDDLNSVKKMTDAVERNKNALIAMSAAEKGSTEQSRRKEIDKITKYLKDNTRISEEAKTKLKEYLDLLRNGGADVNVDEIHNGFLKVTEAERLAGNEGKRFLDVIRDKAWYGWAAQIASYFSLQDIIRYFKEGATVVKEFDDGLTNISYTMDVTKSQLDGIGQSVLDLSKDLKSSIDDSMQVAKIYANMNTTAEEIKKLSEPTLIMSNLTGFDASTMADDIQAVTQQFEIAAEDSMHIADVYDTVSRSISVDYSKILELTLETM